MVSCKVPKEHAGLLTEDEGIYFDALMEETGEILKKHGIWPVFEMEEIDYDDPILDIYPEQTPG